MENVSIINSSTALFSWLEPSLKMIGERRSPAIQCRVVHSRLEMLRQNRNVVAAMEKMQNAQNQDWQYRDVL